MRRAKKVRAPSRITTVELTNSATPGARVHDLKDVEAILDIFQAHGHYEVRQQRTNYCCSHSLTSRPGGLCAHIHRRYERRVPRQDRLEEARARHGHEALSEHRKLTLSPNAYLHNSRRTGTQAQTRLQGPGKAMISHSPEVSS